jgi:hypothetical protein
MVALFICFSPGLNSPLNMSSAGGKTDICEPMNGHLRSSGFCLVRSIFFLLFALSKEENLAGKQTYLPPAF